MRCIATGVLVDEEVNVDKSKEVGGKVLRSVVGKMRTTTDFVRKTQAVTLACKTAVFLTEDNVKVNAQLLFQRLSFVATGRDRVILLQLERSPLLVYTKAGLKKAWIRYDIRDSTENYNGDFICTARMSPSYFCSRCLP